MKASGSATSSSPMSSAARCSCTLIDATEEDVAAAYRTVRNEVEAYGHGLGDKPEVVALNKCDAILEEEIELKRSALEKAAGARPLAISGAAGMGVTDALRALRKALGERREEEKVPAEAPGDWRP